MSTKDQQQGRQRALVYVHHSIPHLRTRAKPWAALLERLGAAMTDAPQPGVTHLVVSEPFAASGNLEQLLEELARLQHTATIAASGSSSSGRGSRTRSTDEGAGAGDTSPGSAVRAQRQQQQGRTPGVGVPEVPNARAAVQVVRPSWLAQCAAVGQWVDPAAYCLRPKLPWRAAGAGQGAAAAPQELQGLSAAEAAGRPTKRPRLSGPGHAPPMVMPMLLPSGPGAGSSKGGPGASGRSGDEGASEGHGGTHAGSEVTSDGSAGRAGTSGSSGSSSGGERAWPPPLPDFNRSPRAAANAAWSLAQDAAAQQPVPERPWVPARRRGGCSSAVPSSDGPPGGIGWWDATHGSWVVPPDHAGLPRQVSAGQQHSIQGQQQQQQAGAEPPRAAHGGCSAAAAAAAAGEGSCCSLKVVTYNVLSNRYCMQSSTKGRNLPHRRYLQWSYRGLRLLRELLAYDADVICLQEVDLSLYQRDVQPWAQEHGYSASYLGRKYGPGSKAVSTAPAAAAAAKGVAAGGGGSELRPAWQDEEGVVMMHRTARFARSALRLVRLADHVPPPREQLGAEYFWAAVSKREEGAIMALLTPLQAGQGDDGSVGDGIINDGNTGSIVGGGDRPSSGGAPAPAPAPAGKPARRARPVPVPICVVCSHLWYDPKWPDLKLAQVHLMCQQAARFLEEAAGGMDPRDVPLIVAGDLNSTWLRFRGDEHDALLAGGCLASGVYTLMATGRVACDHPHHPYRRNRLSSQPHLLRALAFTTSGLALVSSQLAASGREPPVTNRTNNFSGCLDYIWCSREHWAVVEVLDLPYRYSPDPRVDEALDDHATGGAAAAATDGRVPCVLPGPGLGSSGGAGSASAGDALVLGIAGRDSVQRFPEIPTAEWPSDHLAIGARLLLLPPRPLPQ